MADELKATPVKREWALKLADALRSGREYANKLELPFFGGAGDFVLGKTPEGLERVAYDEPLTSGSGWTTRLRPETVDMGFTALDVLPVGKVLAKGLRKGTEAASTAAVRGITGNPNATPIGVIDEIQRMNLLPSATVWHGSPHTFEKFDLSKIGTGEGAQSYGHGLYLAEARPTAEEYAKTLSGETFKVGNEVFDPHSLQHLNVRTAAYGGDVDKALEKARAIAAGDSPVANLAKQDLAVLENIKAQGGMMPNEGNLYKVDLPDEQIAKMLDWDKTLSEQPEVLGATQKLVEDLGELYPSVKEVMATPQIFEGQHLYQAMINSEKSPERASRSLNAIGIPGIQYLDQASRGAGEGTRNYVVFSDEIPQILERNGQPIAQALRNYEAPKQAFDVTRQDASDIFGEGASRIRYQDPNTQGFIDVLQKPDGTASVLGLEVPEAARGKGIGQSLQQQVLSDFPEMQGQVSSKAAATTAHRIGRRPVGNPEATLDDVFRMIDEDSSVNLVSPEMQKRFNFGG